MHHSFQAGERWAILGPNGSGKSTLLKVLSGHLTPSKGDITFEDQGVRIKEEAVYKKISYAAPYIELIEEFTLEEMLRFHSKLKPFLPGFTPASIYELLALPRSRQKEIRFFSSGMKQRLKLALAVCSDTAVLLLDEPATNLDVQGVEWYKNLISEYAAERLVIIASNDPHDAEFCGKHLNIMEFK
jgi:ABC-type multidrug transport system ATPase subunit